MGVTVDDLSEAAERLSDAIAAYERYLEEWVDEDETVTNENTAVIDAEIDPETSLGVTLTEEVVERYHEARGVQAAYVQQARERERPDWSEVVAETEPLRGAARRVHTAGYSVDPETDEPGYLLPREQCPAARVSMNAGSSPVSFDDRVAQYRAVADHFDLSPEIVYHPGSGHDVSLSAAFSDSRVVYLDIDEAAMADLRRAGYEAVGADAAGYRLSQAADVIVFRNAGLMEEPIVLANLRKGGWVLSNDHLESARHVVRLDDLELVGVVPDDWTGDVPPVETEDLQAYRSRLAAGESGSEDAPVDLGLGSQAPESKGSPLDLYVFRDRR